MLGAHITCMGCGYFCMSKLLCLHLWLWAAIPRARALMESPGEKLRACIHVPEVAGAHKARIESRFSPSPRKRSLISPWRSVVSRVTSYTVKSEEISVLGREHRSPKAVFSPCWFNDGGLGWSWWHAQQAMYSAQMRPRVQSPDTHLHTKYRQ